MAEAVNVMDVVDARSTEIVAAVAAVRSNPSVSYRLAIPFHMRRRAASHNPKRIPSKFRPAEESENKSKSHKKWKRKRRKNASIAGKATRLTSHLWHAKRCHMKDVWGYRIAMKTTQKGTRAAYRALGTACNIIDTSYYCWISVSSQDLHGKLSPVLLPNPTACYNRVLSSHLYDNDMKCLGPVRLFWVTEKTVFIRIHPGTVQKSTLGDLFKGLEWQVFKDRFCQYTVCGVRSLELLSKSLKLDAGSPEEVLKLWQSLSLHPFRYDIMRGTAFGLKAIVPPAAFKSYSRLNMSDIQQPEHRLSPCGEYQPTRLFRELSEYSPPECTLKETREVLSKSDETSSSTWFLIYRDPITADYEVVFEDLFRARFWVELVYNGGRAIGWEDYSSLLTERQLLVFPRDYPDTTVGAEFMESTGGELRDKELRRPPQKRVNYEKLRINYPFVPNFMELSPSSEFRILRDPNLLNQHSRTLLLNPDCGNFVSVVVTCYDRGVLQPRSPIYVTNQNVRPRDISPTNMEGLKVVGYITSGHFAHSIGKSEGIGVMLLTAVPSEQHSNVSSNMLLSRKVTSPHFRKITVRVIGA